MWREHQHHSAKKKSRGQAQNDASRDVEEDWEKTADLWPSYKVPNSTPKSLWLSHRCTTGHPSICSNSSGCGIKNISLNTTELCDRTPRWTRKRVSSAMRTTLPSSNHHWVQCDGVGEARAERRTEEASEISGDGAWRVSSNSMAMSARRRRRGRRLRGCVLGVRCGKRRLDTSYGRSAGQVLRSCAVNVVALVRVIALAWRSDDDGLYTTASSLVVLLSLKEYPGPERPKILCVPTSFCSCRVSCLDSSYSGSCNPASRLAAAAINKHTDSEHEPIKHVVKAFASSFTSKQTH